MIKTLLSFFGYAKVPRAAIRLSIIQEDFFKRLIETTGSDAFSGYLKNQKTLTEYLRSGQLLS